MDAAPSPPPFSERFADSFKSLMNGTADLSRLPPSFSAVINHPNRRYLAYGCLASVVLIYFLRRWRLSRARHWTQKIWIYTWTLCLLLVTELLVVPWFVFGDAYFAFARDLVAALSQQLKR